VRPLGLGRRETVVLHEGVWTRKRREVVSKNGGGKDPPNCKKRKVLPVVVDGLKISPPTRKEALGGHRRGGLREAHGACRFSRRSRGNEEGREMAISKREPPNSVGKSPPMTKGGAPRRSSIEGGVPITKRGLGGEGIRKP